MVHRLEGDQGEPSVDGQLGERLVLHAVRPAPQDLTLAQLGHVAVQRLGLQDDVALGDQLLVAAHAGDELAQVVVADAEPLAVAGLEVHPLPQVGRHALEVPGVQAQTVLVLLLRAPHDPEAQGGARRVVATGR